MHGQQNQFLTLTQAAKIAPGRPSTNCIWRWCRRGVLARSGERVKLEHIRSGGKLYTTEDWIAEFGKRLANADATYFDRRDTESCERLSTPTRCQSDRFDAAQRSASSNDEIERELQEAGL